MNFIEANPIAPAISTSPTQAATWGDMQTGIRDGATATRVFRSSPIRSRMNAALVPLVLDAVLFPHRPRLLMSSHCRAALV